VEARLINISPAKASPGTMGARVHAVAEQLQWNNIHF
jgi:hypothetical protein